MELVNQWKLENDEIEIGKNKMKAMLRIHRKGEWRKDEMETFFNDWKQIAIRLRKGTEMVDNTASLREKSVNYREQLEGLYNYLMLMLGMYDSLFRHMFRNQEEMYRRAQAVILDELK